MYEIIYIYVRNVCDISLIFSRFHLDCFNICCNILMAQKEEIFNGNFFAWKIYFFVLFRKKIKYLETNHSKCHSKDVYEEYTRSYV